MAFISSNLTEISQLLIVSKYCLVLFETFEESCVFHGSKASPLQGTSRVFLVVLHFSPNVFLHNFLRLESHELPHTHKYYVTHFETLSLPYTLLHFFHLFFLYLNGNKKFRAHASGVPLMCFCKELP